MCLPYSSLIRHHTAQSISAATVPYMTDVDMEIQLGEPLTKEKGMSTPIVL